MQFRTLEEQIFRAMAVLFDQQERQAVVRLSGMTAPVSIYTPEVTKKSCTEERRRDYLEGCYKKLPFALTGAEAQKQIAERAETFVETLSKEKGDDSTTAKRRIK